LCRAAKKSREGRLEFLADACGVKKSKEDRLKPVLLEEEEL